MKKLFLIISLLAIATWANAFDLQVFWDDPNNPAGSLTGYKLKIGEATKTYTTVITIENPAARTYTITAFDTTFPKATYYMAMTAYHSTAESDNSNEVTYFKPPGSPRIVKMSIVGGKVIWTYVP
jgi:hypothetical protein